MIRTKLISILNHIRSLQSEQVQISIQGLIEHKMRSFLTMLGIIFGVAAVIAMLAIGEGARRQALAQIQALGLQNIIVQNTTQPDEIEGESVTLLNHGDMTAVVTILPTIDSGVPLIEVDTEINYLSRFEEIKLIGTQPEYFSLMSMKIARGGYFSHLDNKYHNRVCVLGHDLAKKLFLLEDALGKNVKIENTWFTVVGILAYQPISVAGNTEINLNNYAIAPLDAIRLRFDRDPRASDLDQIILHVTDGKYVASTSDFIDQIIYRRHNKEKNYKLIVPEQLLRQSEETQKMFNIVMGAIAGISLLVGGIGIMNIMLASILERTREIGVRRSLGAKKADIRNQFLVEALILSLIGGLIGIAFGYAMTFIVTIYSDWETAVSLWSILLSFGVSSLVGIIFGYFPARKAAELDPIEALRYE